MSVTAWMIREGDRVVLRPIWPEGRLVVDVSHGPLDKQVRVTFDGDDEPRAFYGASDHVVVRRTSGYDGTYVEDHCPECGEYDSECSCGERAEIEDRVTY
ncbi:hypothetical protein [Burkholderia multivorans]|uniref:hypothetical protein n=1 Tax=Burkholderia multivorans TaxID=87883 RepID=UPI00057E231A|nr:hypothetical protein [Burkholderia multivorans]KHS09441.1 hypothetical protein BMD20_29700 [Burkholderia multivorans]KHS10362.1 hypothetical protein BMD22_28125 [Burkholderia multivorans]HDR9474355.1 hypothetical protein [Burkholderia multivorans]HDR9480197.1 hypothetical protein [Burkholderia multivorans]